MHLVERFGREPMSKSTAPPPLLVSAVEVPFQEIPMNAAPRNVGWPIQAIAVFAAFVAPAVAQESPPSVRFEERLIAGGYGYAFGVQAADLDGDGDQDLTSCDTDKGVLYWYENDGKGQFTRRVIQDQEAGWFERHAIGDMNGDRKPDVVIVKNQHGHVVWFENGGQPREPKNWRRHVVTTDLMRAYDVALADFDGDGRLDIAATAWSGNHIAWFANPGASNPPNWKKEMIDPALMESRTVRIADFNGDGKPDVLATGRTGNLTAWYEQTRTGERPWLRHVIDDKSVQPIHGEPADMDGDGDADVLMAHGMLAAETETESNRVVWYENVGKPGRGAEWKRHVLARLPFAFEAAAADLDGDKDLDVVATIWGGEGGLVWLQNPGRSDAGWSKHVLKDRWVRANQPIVADLDGDGRPDIAATAERGSNELRWWRNAGRPAP